ncbi:MAG: outer membrane protein assembly factor BamE [Hyphomonadaceae bacterium]
MGTTAALALLAGAAACTPTQEYHGYVADQPGEDLPVQIGVDTKETVQRRLGSPSTTATLDQTAWYYISSTQQRFAYFHPRTTDRRVTVVRFDDNNVVSAVDRFGVERGRVIAYNDNKTPTRGRELGILEQIFGNIGSTPPIRTEDAQNPRGRR